MAQFFGLTPLNAANFESGAATDGQVLTADGAGGAAFEDAAGGGGGAAWDGASFTVNTNSGGVLNVTVQLTSGANNYEEFAFVPLGIYDYDSGYLAENDVGMQYMTMGFASVPANAGAIGWTNANGTLVFEAYNSSNATYNINILVALPNGGVAKSDNIAWVSS